MRFRVSALGALVLAFVLVSGAAARPVHHPGFHRPFFHPHAGGRVFIGGSVFFDPFLYPYYPYYPVPYPYPVYGYAPPPPEEEASGPPPEPGEEQHSAMEEATRRANYGLVQLRGVPDGASVDLDGRFWLTADALDGRWLALPEGEHAIAVRARGFEPAEHHIDVKAGKSQVVRFGPFRHGGARA